MTGDPHERIVAIADSAPVFVPPETDGGGGDRGEPPNDGRDDAAKFDRELALLPCTDLGNVDRFVRRFGHFFRWCAPIGWLAWDGRRWSDANGEELVEGAVQIMIKKIRDEAKALRGSPDDFEVPFGKKETEFWSEKVARWAVAAQANKHIACVEKRIKTHLVVTVRQLDADPWKFSVANGTIVIDRNAEGDPISIKPHDPADLITKISSVIYDPAAECPIYDGFIADVQPLEADRRFLHQWGGVSLTGDTSDQRIVIEIGGGKNGKSTKNEIFAHVAGDYAASVPIETFLDQGRARRGGEATPDLARLPGVRFLRTSEPERGAKLAEALIKIATGGEPITARHLNKPFFEFPPQFKLTIAGNHKPQIRGTDEGIWRRVTLLPWGITIPEEKRDLQLVPKLKAEASGVLNRLLDGLRDWLEHGLVLPDSVEKATAKYREESDPLGRFLTACTRPAPGKRVQSSELHRVFCAWAKAAGEREWSNMGLTKALLDRGYHKGKSDIIVWDDLELIKTVNDFVDHEGKPLGGAESSIAPAAADYGADETF